MVKSYAQCSQGWTPAWLLPSWVAYAPHDSYIFGWAAPVLARPPGTQHHQVDGCRHAHEDLVLRSAQGWRARIAAWPPPCAIVAATFVQGPRELDPWRLGQQAPCAEAVGVARVDAQPHHGQPSGRQALLASFLQ
eukprot:365807-Chlamydomonas_euryale.AAC.7